MAEKWEKQEGETSKNYKLFCLYRDMGITRTFKKVAEKLEKGENYNKYLSKLSALHHWTERVEAYDVYLDEETRKANLEGIRKMNEELIQQGRQLRQLTSARIGGMLQRLKAAFDSKNPETIEAAMKDIPTYLIPSFAKVSAELERMGRGVGEKVEIDATVEHVINVDEVKNKILSKIRSANADSGDDAAATPG